MKRYFDLAAIIPLDEEFETALSHFRYVANLSTGSRIRFQMASDGSPLDILFVKQNAMGRTENVNAALDILDEFDVGLLVCLGIAGGLSSDLNIGDVCRTGAIADLLDNSKVSDVAVKARKPASRSNKADKSQQEISFSPTHYETPTEISVALDLDKLVPERKEVFDRWVNDRMLSGESIMPQEFTGKDGRKEKLGAPSVKSGLIACAAVAASPDYNRSIKKLDRKILAVETESGGMFSVVKRLGIPALTIRGISDYAGFGVDKNQFETETNNKARFVAASNAASYLAQQTRNPLLVRYLQDRLQGKTHQHQSPNNGTTDPTASALIARSDHFNSRLRELAPGFSLDGYRIPVPRIRLRSDDLEGAVRPTTGDPIEIRDALTQTDIIVVEVPPQYPDRSLAWVVARDLINSQVSNRQMLPTVIEASNLHKPDYGIEALAQDTIAFKTNNQVKLIFIIDEFNFQSRSQALFLHAEVSKLADAKFVIFSRNRASIIAESEFCTKSGARMATLDDVSFLETSHFIQKNFEMSVAESEVIAIRLRETFSHFRLSAHPSYFAGIPQAALAGLLRANRRAELIEIAVVGYLSYVVADDNEPIALSRTTRENFLTLLAREINVKKRSFSEAELIKFTEEFAERFDYKISAVRFSSAFMQKGILFIENGNVQFTLPFMESYLLAKSLHDDPEEAQRYFQFGTRAFDLPTFALFAELGLSKNFIEELQTRLDGAISNAEQRATSPSSLSSDRIRPALLSKGERMQGIQNRLQKAIAEVTEDHDASREKQRLLDVADRVRSEASRQSERPVDERESNEGDSAEEDDFEVWYVAVSLLGTGAERLEADVKRSLMSKVIKLSRLIIDDWTNALATVDFKEIKNQMLSDEEVIRDIAKSEADVDLVEAKRTVEMMVDLLEYAMLSQPLRVVVQCLCEDGRDAILAHSLANTDCEDPLEDLLRCIWLSDLDAGTGTKGLKASLKSLPKASFLRMVLASHLITRVYWNHWEKEKRLMLLNAAQECLKTSGLQYDQAGLKRLINREAKGSHEDEERKSS
ncbi:5'-methylthioadenosine/S-adenosylhomocysteine nucleosidase family protein [Rhodopseudomonas telluris]|uniref:Nucleoside phosphorylase domain-containing protein n=1 Tax=Rhodopseudomonas telluris TaxID=644215 RepID=A0ABV6ENY5_9BRAD